MTYNPFNNQSYNDCSDLHKKALCASHCMLNTAIETATEISKHTSESLTKHYKGMFEKAQNCSKSDWANNATGAAAQSDHLHCFAKDMKGKLCEMKHTFAIYSNGLNKMLETAYNFWAEAACTNHEPQQCSSNKSDCAQPQNSNP